MARTSADEAQPFLAEKQLETTATNTGDDSDSVTSSAPGSRPRSTRTNIPTKHILFHILLVALYTLFSALTVYALRYDSTGKYRAPAWIPEVDLHPAATVLSPALSTHSGPAQNTSIDALWPFFVVGRLMRASDDELALNGVRSSLRLGHDANLIELGVFRELECLRTVRQFAAQAFWFPSSDPNMRQMAERVEMCVEFMRQNAMCQPDLSLMAFKRGAADDLYELAFDDRVRVRECVDWDAMVESLQDRMTGIEDMEEMRRLAGDSAS